MSRQWIARLLPGSVSVGLLLLLIVAPVSATAQDVVKLPGAIAVEFLGSLVAIQKGFYAQEGIKIQGPIWMSGARVRDGLFSKEYDFALTSLQAAGVARAKGMPFRVIVPLYERQLFSLFARKDLPGKERAASDLKSLLKGLRVGQSGPGTGSWAFAAYVYKKVGLDPKDMQLVNIGQNPQIFLGALRSATADVISIWEPMITMVEEEGLGFPLVDPRDPEVHTRFFGSPEALSEILVTRDDVIKEKPDLVRRMVRATKRGLEYAKARPGAEVAELIQPLMGGVQKAVMSKILERIKPGLADGKFSLASYKAGLDVLVEMGLVKEGLPFESFVDASFAGRRP